VRDLKARWMKVGDGTVEAFMKDIQVDASSFPGKAFEMTFDMPEHYGRDSGDPSARKRRACLLQVAANHVHANDPEYSAS
jgi:hypothetical protein